MNLLRHLPNALTCGNLLCGCIGIIFCFSYSTASAAWFVWAACVFDFFDGFTARALKVASPIGKELDSLADIVSFGVLPAMTMFQLINAVSPSNVLPFSAFMLTVFSALRLAKFNVDENQSESFIGLPTPANALFITALPFLQRPLDIFINYDLSLVVITIIFSLFLVAPIRLFGLKMKSLRWMDNRVQFTFLGVAVLLLVIGQAAALPLVILLYVGASLLKNWIKI